MTLYCSPKKVFWKISVNKSLAFFLLLFLVHDGLAQPKISSFTPTSGVVGTTITVNGANFSTTPANNIVFFGAVRATVITASSTALTVKVPAGATYQPITVTTNNLTAYSPHPFSVTFPGVISSSSFAEKIDSAVGSNPYYDVLSDFDGDGKTDIAVACGGIPSSISVYRNISSSGSISLAAKIELATNATDFAIDASDVNGDGKPDIVVTNADGSVVSVYTNSSTPGNISFTSGGLYFTNTEPEGVVISDLDGDGRPDLVASNFLSSNISILQNNGSNGTVSFAPKIDYATGAYPLNVIAADFDGDNKPDIAVPNNGLLSIYKNTSNGSISFDNKLDFSTNGATYACIAGDFDGDGKIDIAVSSANQVIAILRNISFGGNIAFAAPAYFNISGNSGDVKVADIDGDAKPDLVAGKGSASILRNTSVIGSISFSSKFDFSTGAVGEIAIGDLDGDSKPDIVSTNQYSNLISIFRNIADQPSITSFSPSQGGVGSQIIISGKNFSNVLSVSFGGTTAASFIVQSDTAIKATVGSGTSGSISVTTKTGTSTHAGFTWIPAPTVTSFTPTSGVYETVINITGTNFTTATSVKFGGVEAKSFTVNSPTNISAIVGAGAGGSVTVTTVGGTSFLNGFTFVVPKISSFSPLSGPIGATVTITGSFFSPIITNNIVYFGAVRATVSSATSSSLTVKVPGGATYQPISVNANGLTAYSAQAFNVTFPGGDLNANSFAQLTDFKTGTSPMNVSLSDVDGDGLPDLVVANSYYASKSCSILRNISAGGTLGFAKKVDFSTSVEPQYVMLTDLNGDGKPDMIAAAGNYDHTVETFKNTSTNGHLSFAAPTNFGDVIDGAGPWHLAASDVDGDGKTDIIVVNHFINTISILRNTSTVDSISFDPVVDFVTGDHPVRVCMGDFGNDGKPDVMVINAGVDDRSVSIFKNTCTIGSISFTPEPSVLLGANYSPTSISVGDIDGDKKLDLVLTDNNSLMSVLRNTSTSGIISFDTKIDFPGIYTAGDVGLGDIDGDGKLDAVVIDRGVQGGYGTVSVYKNTSSVGHVSFNPMIGYKASHSPFNVAIGDLDGDGKPDLAVANNGAYGNGNTVSVLKNLISTVLPLTLLDFKGSIVKSESLLNWETTNEENTKYFIVEYSKDGATFSVVGSVLAANNKAIINQYSFVHVSPVAGDNYYRLKIVDNDGKFVYSPIVHLEINSQQQAVLAYPNPTHNYLIIKVPETNVLSSIKVIDLTGRVLKILYLKKGESNTKINLKNVSPGAYKLVWSDGRNTIVKTISVE